MDILQYECVRKWLRNVSGTSPKLYALYFEEFTEFTGLNPDQLLAKDEKEVHELAKQYYENLANQGLASSTCTVAYASIRSFMKWNDKRLGPMPKKFRGHVTYESDTLLQPQEVAKMIDHASTVRDKAIVSFLHQSAQRGSILTALKWGDVRTQIENNVNPVVIDIKAVLLNSKGVNVNKGRTRYKFPFGSETVSYIRRMIEARRESGEQVDDNSWLFVTTTGGPISLKVVMRAVEVAADRAGLQSKRDIGKNRAGAPKVKYEIHAHVFRRTWKHTMRTAGVTDSDLLNFIIGHELSYGGAYDKYDADYIHAAISQESKG